MTNPMELFLEDQVKDQAWADHVFPDAGPPPSNEIVVDPEAREAPNEAHPQ